MNVTTFRKSGAPGSTEHAVYIINKKSDLSSIGFSQKELDYVQNHFDKLKKNAVAINQYDRWIFLQVADDKDGRNKALESLRKAGNDLLGSINSHKIKNITIVDHENSVWAALAFAEGMALGNYQFLHHVGAKGKEKANSLDTIQISGEKISAAEVDRLQSVVEGTLIARDLVNEPLSHLTAVQFAITIERLGTEAGFQVETFNKAKIEALKMGGLLAVNKGSIDPPTFSILEYKPANAVNAKPYVFVGKGIVYDTGGISLKSTAHMDTMKCDMGGGAAVTGAIYSIAKSKLPIYVVGLIPATDNRPDGNAHVPGDIITMYNGMSVEVLNTDAEGRLILGDALSYAKKYDPELTIDLATLTGAAANLTGKFGIVSMGTASDAVHTELKAAGNKVHERLAEMPFWDEYGDLVKSDIADLKNVGGPVGGMITAGKFMQNFVDYPWIHLDIAGPAFLDSRDNYRGKGGSGVGVRLLYEFAAMKCLK